MHTQDSESERNEQNKTQKETVYHPYNMYAVIDNSTIMYSCEENSYVLPLCLFSWAHAVHGYDSYVETNLALIHETLTPTKKASGEYRKIKDTLKLLANDPEGAASSEEEIPGVSNMIEYIEEYRNIKPSTILRYRSFVGYGRHIKGFTQIYIDEYYFLLAVAWCWNYYGTVNYPLPPDEDKLIVDCKAFGVYKSKDKSFKPIDVCLLINLYAYLKMRILQYEAWSEAEQNKDYDIYMRESIETIADRFGKGNRTISRHLRILIDIDMIGVNGRPRDKKNGRFVANKPTHYWLNNKWRE